MQKDKEIEVIIGIAASISKISLQVDTLREAILHMTEDLEVMNDKLNLLLGRL